MSDKALERFWSFVQKGEGCWTWTGMVNRNSGNRAIFYYGGDTTNAARWIYQKLNNVSLSRDEFVCHRCDNPSCVNPEHLFVGSILDNNRDCAAKGRNVRGPQKRFCKRGHELTPENTWVYKTARNCRTCSRERPKAGWKSIDAAMKKGT